VHVRDREDGIDKTILKGAWLLYGAAARTSWQRIWVFQKGLEAGRSSANAGARQSEEGYVDFAGYDAGTQALLIAREVKDRGRFRRSRGTRSMLALVRQRAARALRDFGDGRTLLATDTLALH